MGYQNDNPNIKQYQHIREYIEQLSENFKDNNKKIPCSLCFMNNFTQLTLKNAGDMQDFICGVWEVGVKNALSPAWISSTDGIPRPPSENPFVIFEREGINITDYYQQVDTIGYIEIYVVDNRGMLALALIKEDVDMIADCMDKLNYQLLGENDRDLETVLDVLSMPKYLVAHEKAFIAAS